MYHRKSSLSYSSDFMAILLSDQPVSNVQRRINWGALLLLSLIGVAIGLRLAKQSASITSGYAAAYINPIVVVITLAFLLLGLPLIIYWRTRWIGFGLMAAGILNLAAFGGGLRILLMENRVAWHHPHQMVSIGPDQKFSAVIYFHKEVTDREVQDFTSSVLMESAMPRHPGRDFPIFVRQYLRLSPKQANGHRAIALAFLDNTPTDTVQPYLAVIKADNRVEAVFLNTFPDSIHPDSNGSQ
jgi:hypothetical protein